MKKLSLSSLACLISASLASASAFSQVNDEDMEVVVVTASGVEQKLVEAPASVSVISHADLAKKNFSNLAEALSGIEGVDIRSGTGKTGNLQISIRGMPSSYTLILIDGVRQSASSDATPNGFGSMNTGFMPPLNAIQHVEIIRGPMSTLYGSDAIGGVVNIITKKHADGWQSSINVDHTIQEDDKWGDASTLGFYTSGPLINKTLDLTLRGRIKHRQGTSVTSLSDTRATRIPYPTKSDNYNVGGKLVYTINDNNRVWIDADFAHQKYDNAVSQLGPIGISGGGYEDTLRYEQDKWVIGHDADLSFGHLKTNLLYMNTENQGRVLTPRSIGEDSPYIGEARLLKDSNIILNSRLIAPLGDNHQLTIGAEYWHSKVEDGIVKVSTGESFSEHTFSVYGEDKWQPLDALNITFGARYEKHQSFGGHVSPRLYAVYNINSDWTLKGGVSTGYNTPSQSKLHDGISGIGGNGRVNTIGNPDLDPETSTNYETGLYYENSADFNANVTVFYNRFKDAISSYEIDSVTSTYRNIGKARVEGIELATSFPVLVDEVRFNLNYTYKDSEQIGGADDGAPLNATAKHMLNAQLQWQVNESLSTRLEAEYRGQAPRYSMLYDNLNSTQQLVSNALGADLKDWTVLNLGATYLVNDDIKINASVNNIVDKDFSEVQLYGEGRSALFAGDYFSTSRSTTGFVNPGRNYWLSVTYNF